MALLLLLFTVWINGKVSGPVQELYQCVQQWNQALASPRSDRLFDGAVDKKLAELQARVSSLELTSIVGTFQKLGVALRIAQPCNDGRMEMANLVKALQLVRDKASDPEYDPESVQRDEERGFGVYVVTCPTGDLALSRCRSPYPSLLACRSYGLRYALVWSRLYSNVASLLASGRCGGMENASVRNQFATTVARGRSYAELISAEERGHDPGRSLR